MKPEELEKAFQAIESNSRAIAALSNKIEAERQFYLQRIESNSKAIAALANKLEEERRQVLQPIHANSRAIGEIAEILREMQGAQRSLMQSMGEQQHVLKDFKEIITLILNRLDRTQSKTNEYLDANQQEIVKLRENILTMQQEILVILQDIKTSKVSSHC